MDLAGNALFEQFAEALNQELAALHAMLRVARTPAPDGSSLVIIDGTGQTLGHLPDHVDAETIRAFEAILNERRTNAAQLS